MKYIDEKTKQIAFPLGGIGAGNINIAGNGQLIDWSVFNRPNIGSESCFTHIAIRAFKGGKIQDARVLVSDFEQNCNPNGDGAPVSSMNGFPHFNKNSFVGEFPFCSLEFESEKFPAKLTLEAFSPFIPLDSKNSSLPAAFFEVIFENTSNETVDYEAAFSLRNPFKKSINKKIANGISLCDEGTSNSFTLITDSARMYTTDYWYRGWFNNFCRDNLRMFWESFSSGEDLKDRGYKGSSHGDICTVSGRVSVAPGDKKTVRFIITWYIPECCNYWYPMKDENGLDVTWKNYYATMFKGSEECARYFLNNLEYLKTKSCEFRDCLKATTVDESVKSSIEAGLAVLKSPTVMRLEDGSFYGFEGSAPNQGLCEGICQHVYNYAYVMCYLFPDLEKGIRDNELKYGVCESGESVIRLPLPFGRAEFVNMVEPGKKFVPCVDGHMGTIIKICREWKLSGDNEWLRRNWDKVTKMLEFIWSPENDQHWDTTQSGILTGRQHHTLDLELFGPSGWLQGFYLAALRAAVEMAEFLGDTANATLYRTIFEKGYKDTKERLFNGEYFIQSIDLCDKSVVNKFGLSERYWNEYKGELTHQIGEGCLIDQLVGLWHSVLIGLDDVFDKEQAQRAAYSIFENNYKENMRDFVNPWRLFSFNDDGGTIICSYPTKYRKPKIPLLYSEEVMSGFEYAYAGVLAICGFIEESLCVIKTARARYDGERRNPWNDSECGNYYARSMSSYALLSIYSGYSADLPRKRYSFMPRLNERPFRSIFSMGTGWGEFTVDDSAVTVILKSGFMDVSEISIPLGLHVLSVIVDGKETEFCQHNNTVFLNAHSENQIIIEVKKHEA